MSRRVTLRNSPSCETDNPFFKVIVLPGRVIPLFDVLSLVENQIFPNKLFGIGQPLVDVITPTEAFRLFTNTNAFVSLTDLVGVFDVHSVKSTKAFKVSLSDSLSMMEYLSSRNNQRYTIVLSDRVETPTDEFDVTKTRKTITVTLRDGITLSD